MSSGLVTVGRIEKEDYIASAADIEALMREQLSVISLNHRSRATYLRALVATTQKELGLTQRQRERHARLKKIETESQIQALETVHERFYAAVIKAIDDTPLAEDEMPTSGRKTQNAIRSRRATFARTAKSMLRTWLSVGNDIGGLVPAKLTKGSLVLHGSHRRRRAVSVSRLVSRVGRQSTDIMQTIIQLSELDKEKALKELQTLSGMLTKQLQTIAPPTRDAATALDEFRPFIAKGKTFLPSQTGVLRSAARTQ